MLNRENVGNSLIMIQPTLDAYSFNGPPVPGIYLTSNSDLGSVAGIYKCFTRQDFVAGYIFQSCTILW